MRFVPAPRPRPPAERPFDVFLAIERGAPLDAFGDRVLADALGAAREAGLVAADRGRRVRARPALRAPPRVSPADAAAPPPEAADPTPP